MNWHDKTVLIMGLGTKDGGVGAALFAARQGARVWVSDLQPAEALAESMAALADVPVRWLLGRHDAADFAAADVVIANETIPRSHPLLRHAAAQGAVIESPMSLFGQGVRLPFIGVTGTKGKSTVSHLVGHMLAADGAEAVVAGNNCVSALRHLRASPLVLELSSQQLPELTRHGVAPHVACWTCFFPDHLNAYGGDLDAYFADKARITQHQGAPDFLVLPRGDARLRALPTAARRVFFGATSLGRAPGWEVGVEAGDVVARMGAGTLRWPLAALPAPWRVSHPLELVLAGMATALAWGASPAAVWRGACSFPGLPSRFRQVAHWKGLRFIDDSAASTPESVVCALRAVAAWGPVVLIGGGGGDKGLDFSQWGREVAARVEALLLLGENPGSARLAAAAAPHAALEVIPVADLAEAVAVGVARLGRCGGGTLLLSPGCCGWPAFPDQFVRGRRFCEAVEALTARAD